MRGYIIYESAYGNTEMVARTIAESLGKYGPMTLFHAPEARAIDVNGSDLLVIGSPTQLHKAPHTINEWLDGLPIDGLQKFPVATFDTRYQMAKWRSGSAAQLIAKRVQKLGAVLVSDPESFFVTRKEGTLMEGELERVPIWADLLYKNLLEYKKNGR